MQVGVAYSHPLCTYLVLVAGLFTFRELTLGAVRKFLTIMAAAAIVVAVLGIGTFLLTGKEYRLLHYNQILATVSLFALLPFLTLPSLRRKYGVLKDHRFLLAGYFIFGVEALLDNLLRPFGYQPYAIFSDLGFAAFILAIGYVSMERVYSSERRLLSIENELAIARQLQFSILPTSTLKCATCALRLSMSP